LLLDYPSPLHFQENVATRGTVLELIVPEDHLEVLDELGGGIDESY
jgi:hypothetical protein